ncbi:hypothetical protein [Janthinobacterium sp. HH102]|uniref:hypothetical protein n=1 Tax=Janthinobacterium sp. HH102 TaxID=1537274 RepID=UPI0011131536|nr:hypothetical protein [Janthinobacterium sp. HH102]
MKEKMDMSEIVKAPHKMSLTEFRVQEIGNPYYRDQGDILAVMNIHKNHILAAIENGYRVDPSILAEHYLIDVGDMPEHTSLSSEQKEIITGSELCIILSKLDISLPVRFVVDENFSKNKDGALVVKQIQHRSGVVEISLSPMNNRKSQG